MAARIALFAATPGHVSSSRNPPKGKQINPRRLFLGVVLQACLSIIRSALRKPKSIIETQFEFIEALGDVEIGRPEYWIGEGHGARAKIQPFAP